MNNIIGQAPVQDGSTSTPSASTNDLKTTQGTPSSTPHGALPHETLVKAVRYLAGVCDGAARLDGHGFNKLDTHFGKDIADRPPVKWTPRIQAAAYKMVKKYRKQLAAVGIDIVSVPKPDVDKLLQEWEQAKRQQAAEKAGETKPLQVQRISMKNGLFLIEYPYNPKWNDELRQCVGYAKFYKDPMPHFALPANQATVNGLRRFVRGKGFEATQEVKDFAEKLSRESTVRSSLSQATDSELKVDGLGGTLLPFQRAGVEYILNAKRVLLGDHMGLGKTVQALAAAQAANAFPMLVVCPRTVKKNWEREAKKWLPGKRVFVLSAFSWKRARVPKNKFDILILNYDLMGRHKGKLCIFPRELTPKSCNACRVIHDLTKRQFQMMVFDEAHKVKSYDRNRTMAVKMLAPQIPWLIGATGTPVLNYPHELVSPLEILGHIDAFGGRWAFIRRYCAPTQSFYGIDTRGAANLQELNQRLRSLCYIRRTKDEVLKELPPKRRSMVPIELDNRAEYERVETDLKSWLIDKMLNKGSKNPVQDAHRSLQAEQLVRIEALKQVAANGKIASVIDWIADFLESKEKLVVFAHHQSVQAKLAAAFPQCAQISSGQNDETRNLEELRFTNDPKCNLIVCSLKAGGEGINLQAASNVAFIELGWNPATHDQAEDRCHRIGQHDQVNAWYLLAEDTIDMEIADLIEKKRAIVDTTTDGTDGVKDEGILNALVDKLIGGDVRRKMETKRQELRAAELKEAKPKKRLKHRCYCPCHGGQGVKAKSKNRCSLCKGWHLKELKQMKKRRAQKAAAEVGKRLGAKKSKR